MRVRGEAFAHQDDTRLRSPLVAAAIDVFPGCARPLIRPCGAPSPGGRRGARGAWSPSPPGRGVGVRVRCEAFAHQDSTRLRPHPCPPPRSIYPQASPAPSSAPSGHLLPVGEGERVAPGAPLPPGEGWGVRVRGGAFAHQNDTKLRSPLVAAAIDVFQASPVSSSAPAGHLLPVGEGERAAMGCCWCCALRRPLRLNRRAIFTRPFPAACYGLHPQRRFFAYHGRSSRVPLR